MVVEDSFWKGRKVFITGHTGFKGSWLALWLQEMGATVKGYSLESPTNPSLFNEAKVEEGMLSEYGDIRDFDKLKASIARRATISVLRLIMALCCMILNVRLSLANYP